MKRPVKGAFRERPAKVLALSRADFRGCGARFHAPTPANCQTTTTPVWPISRFLPKQGQVNGVICLSDHGAGNMFIHFFGLIPRAGGWQIRRPSFSSQTGRRSAKASRESRVNNFVRKAGLNRRPEMLAKMGRAGSPLPAGLGRQPPLPTEAFWFTPAARTE